MTEVGYKQSLSTEHTTQIDLLRRRAAKGVQILNYLARTFYVVLSIYSPTLEFRNHQIYEIFVGARHMSAANTKPRKLLTGTMSPSDPPLEQVCQ
ncbi:MAG: hypothetical protein CM1200mP22_03190 [Dehalococcoidia bacterium]|nr:MAG: hypothetical protein CM1200mP22_03190 [Dehalococcoidia bacterium]